ncbi:uncharacterized protein LOC133814190 [Humulus lupulus]|uniref:uncharacterized protein LOC133814190 n=1 Tax=Humulus lupulus TaxID=3486 RepID=UPI002B416BC1|nr:uncharacterized protein LOC133814190 [Humulus lupulus]
MKAIANCDIAKDAWDKLQTKNEGTKNVKKSRLRSLTTEFENLAMRDDESVTEFHARLCDITNESFALGETYADSKLVRMVLGALPRKFKSKVTSIEECHDVDTLDLDELIGSLQNYELTMKRWSKEKKEKRVSSGVALSHKVTENLFVGDSLENLDEEKVALLAKNYAKFLRNNMKKGSNDFKGENSRKPPNFPRKTTHMGEKEKSKGEEDQKAAEEDSSDLEENFVAFTVKTSETPCSDTDSDGVCSDEDDLDQQTAYEQMYNQWVSVIKKAKSLEIKVGELEEERRNLLGKVDFLTLDIEEKRVALEEMQEKLDYANKTIETYTVGQDLFDNMMGIGQFAREKHGVGFNQPLAIKKKDIPSSSQKVPPISPSFVATSKNSPATTKFIPICHFCGKKRHICPRYKAQVSLVGRKQWRPKNAHTKALVVHTSLLACNSDQWYFDNGCSRHMTGNKHLLTNILSYVEGYVTFGDGSKGRIMGRGKLHLHGLPPLENVLYVEGLKANLISVSQICDEGCMVLFSKTDCTVVSTSGIHVLTRIRSNDKCYLLRTNLVCNEAKTDETEQWHYKFGHLNYRDLESLSGKRYVMVCVDDYTRFSWVRFLREKFDSFENFKGLCLSLQAEKGEKVKKVIRLRSDHGKEFENNIFADFGNQEGIAHEFSAPKTPQQNGVVERKNRTLQEMARVMLNAKKLSKRLWAEAVNTTCYISNRVHLRPGTKQTSYELWKGRTPNLAYLHVFGCKCFILNDRENLGKFDTKSDEGVFLGYSTNSRAYRIYNMRTQAVMESINVVFSDLEDFSSYSKEEEIHTLVDTSILPVASRTTDEPSGSKIEANDATIETSEAFDVSSIPENIASFDLKIHQKKGPPTWIPKVHPLSSIVGNPNEPKSVKDALKDENWISSMQDELHQFERMKNKTDEVRNVVRNKASLVVQGYTQIEGVDFEETFAPVARLESVRLLLVVACYMKFKLYQMDVKSAFLNGILVEEAYVSQPPRFEDPHHGDHVYKLNKALYGLKQAPRAWYDRLTSYLLDNGYTRDDIVFGSTCEAHTHYFVQLMTKEFEMSMVGELSYILGLQIKQLDNGILLSQSKYAKNMLKTFGLENAKHARTPMGTTAKLIKDKTGKKVDATLYRSMIGSLLYITASCPDICFSVGVCARY